MKALSTTILLVLLPANAAAAPARPHPPGMDYFPPASAQPKLHCPPRNAPSQHENIAVDAFHAEWFSGHLAAAGEPSLYRAARVPRAPGERVLRFTWLPSFDPAVIVRIVWEAGKPTRLIATLSSGLGGYGPGKVAKRVDRPLTGAESARLNALLARANPIDPPEAECAIGLDGAEWVIEDVGAAGYRVVRRWSPESGRVRKVGLAMLGLTGWKYKRIY